MNTILNKPMKLIFSLILIPFFSLPNVYAIQEVYSLVLEGGRVIDPETGLDAVRNVGIINGEIVAISEKKLTANEVINVSGKVVAPGFIDLHTHSPTKLGQDYQALGGVTTALELEIGSYPIDAYGDEISKSPRINFGSSVGHLPIRLRVKMGLEVSHIVKMGSPKPININGYWTAVKSLFSQPDEGTTELASVAEKQEILARLSEGLDNGALGIGLGLDYVSDGVDQAELDMIFDLASERGVPVFIHLRRGVNGDPSGLDEALKQSRRSGASLHICHITHNAMKNTELFLTKIRDARAEGIDVTTEILPFNAGSASISASVFTRNWQEIFDITYSDVEWAATGKRFNKEMWQEYQQKYPQGQVIHHYVKEEWTQRALQEPGLMVVSDLLPMESLDKKVAPHNGAFSKILGTYVRDKELLSLSTALSKMTLLPAQRLQKFAPVFNNKGRIQLGADADITVFDPATIQNRATYDQPYQGPTGIDFVIVNGSFVVKYGALQHDNYPGKRLKSTD
ncbi:MAG: N-acyl-D-aspartate/D-glutamate deacylase [Chitinophagales bacterium]|jgi:N-acyl-D-aspartate/D-glutamate deacylase